MAHTTTGTGILYQAPDNLPVLRKKVLVLVSRVPYPLDKGDKLRAFYHIRELSRNHDIYLVALSDEPPHPNAADTLRTFVKDVVILRFNKIQAACRLAANIFSNKPFQVAYFYSNRFHKIIKNYIRTVDPDHIYCQLIRMADYAIGSGIDTTLDYQDAFSSGLLRRAKSAPWYFKPLLLKEYQLVKRFETAVARVFDKKLIISKPDRDFFPEPLRKDIQVIVNGVDTSWFAPRVQKKQYHIIFSGNMAYPPNIDACHFLIRDIMPKIWESMPEATVVLAGAKPHNSIKKLSSHRVIVTGWVDDLRPLYASASIMIAPMRLGSGLQNKILEAMAMKVPVVTSPLANQAIEAIDGKQILISNDAKEFAQHALSLLHNSDIYNKLSNNGLEFVLQKFCWKTLNSKLENLIISPIHS